MSEFASLRHQSGDFVNPPVLPGPSILAPSSQEKRLHIRTIDKVHHAKVGLHIKGFGVTASEVTGKTKVAPPSKTGGEAVRQIKASGGDRAGGDASAPGGSGKRKVPTPVAKEKSSRKRKSSTKASVETRDPHCRRRGR